jgi:hypothetical protein
MLCIVALPKEAKASITVVAVGGIYIGIALLVEMPMTATIV